MSKENMFVDLGNELDKESATWLEDNCPALWDALEVAIIRGATAEEARAFVVRHAGIHREALARRIEAAARWLIGQKVGA
jgi:hypothetical protein